MNRPTEGSRVVDSHRIAAAALRLAALFGLVAAIWAARVFISGGSAWPPFHAFLMGTAVLAISGLTQMFTITWSTSPAPPAATVTMQRWAIALGAAMVLIGLPNGIDWLVFTGGVLLLVGLALLGASLVSIIRRSLLRRFDLSSRFYLVAFANGMVGIVLGIIMGTGLESSTLVRIAHSRLNLVGLLGFTILGTLPTLLPTLAHSKPVAGREAVVALWMSMVAALLFVAGIWMGPETVGIGVLVAGGALGAILLGSVSRLGGEALRSGLPYLQVVVGGFWLLAWTVADGIQLTTGSLSSSFAPWIQAAVVAGVVQVMLGSLAYLAPVLVGPPPRLGRNLSRMAAHSWVPLALANLAGISFVIGWTKAAGVAAGMWLLDFLGRLVRLEWRSLDE